jgi:hypothetical protein
LMGDEVPPMGRIKVGVIVMPHENASHCRGNPERICHCDEPKEGWHT